MPPRKIWQGDTFSVAGAHFWLFSSMVGLSTHLQSADIDCCNNWHSGRQSTGGGFNVCAAVWCSAVCRFGAWNWPRGKSYGVSSSVTFTRDVGHQSNSLLPTCFNDISLLQQTVNTGSVSRNEDPKTSQRVVGSISTSAPPGGYVEPFSKFCSTHRY